jgi:hypothetical protein
MNHDIGTMFKGILNIRTEKRIVDDNENAVTVGNASHLADIDQTKSRIGRGLNPNQLGVIGPDQLLDVDLNGRSKSDVHSVCSGNLGEVAMGAAVHIRH